MLRPDVCLTGLVGKKKLKSEKVFDLLGELDELQVCLGLVKVFSGGDKELLKTVGGFQKDLLKVGGFLSGWGTFPWKRKTGELEKSIGKLKDDRLQNFLLPGDSASSVYLHQARVVTRRLERRVVGLKKEKFYPLVAYFNRLSSLFFWLAYRNSRRG